MLIYRLKDPSRNASKKWILMTYATCSVIFPRTIENYACRHPRGCVWLMQMFFLNISIIILLYITWVALTLKVLELLSSFNVYPVFPVCRVFGWGRVPRAHKEFSSKGERVWRAGKETAGDWAQHLQGTWSTFDWFNIYSFAEWGSVDRLLFL